MAPREGWRNTWKSPALLVAQIQSRGEYTWIHLISSDHFLGYFHWFFNNFFSVHEINVFHGLADQENVK